jgi:tetratricopeptide (TPR) repeat protein
MPAALLRTARQVTLATLVVGSILIAAIGVAIWWFGPWNAEARYYRMQLLALHQLADDQPTNKVAWHVLGLRLAHDGDAGLAEPALRQALAVDSNDTAVASALSQLLTASGRPEEAFQLLKQAEGRSPTNITIRMNLGRFYQQKGAFHHAVEEYEAVIAVDKRNANAWYRLAQCDFTIQRIAQAQDALQKAIGLEPSDPDFLIFQAQVDGALGHTEQAIAAARKSASLAPNNLLIQANFAEMLLHHHRSEAELQEAEATIGRMEQADASFPPLSSLRGDLEADRGHWDAAARYYQKAAEVMRDSDHAYYALGRAYRRLGRTADAERAEAIYKHRQELRLNVNAIQSAIGAQPKSADLYARLADAELGLGHQAEAIAALEHAAAISPGKGPFAARLAKLKGAAPAPAPAK